MYPNNDSTIVTTTAAMSTRSFQEEAEEFGSDCEVANFMKPPPENYIGTTSD